MRAIFDTNILIGYFDGNQKAKKEIELYEFRAISIITYLEFLFGINEPETLKIMKKYLQSFYLI